MDIQMAVNQTSNTTSSGKPMYRLQFLDMESGNVVSDIDVVTSAECVRHINDNPIIKEGLGFNKGDKVDIQLSELVNRVLYPYYPPEFVSFGNTGFDTNIDGDMILTFQKGIVKEKSIQYITIMAGSDTLTKCALVRYHNGRRTVIETKVLSILPGEKITLDFNLPKIISNVAYGFELSDGKNIVRSPKLIYEFKLPIFMGTINNSDMITITDMGEYINSFIKNNTSIKNTLSEYNTDQKDFIYTDNTHPFILVPLKWNSLNKVIDNNGFNIINLYERHIVNIDVNDNKELYALYIVKHPIIISNGSNKEITYNFTYPKLFHNSEHIESDIFAGFNVTSPGPIDSRFVKNTRDELPYITNAYPGLIVYVMDVNTYYKYNNNGTWEVVNNKTHLHNGKPFTNMGGILDISFDIHTGDVWQKNTSGVWEVKGNIRTGEVK